MKIIGLVLDYEIDIKHDFAYLVAARTRVKVLVLNVKLLYAERTVSWLTLMNI